MCLLESLGGGGEGEGEGEGAWGCKKEKLFDVVENISKNIYYNYCRNCTKPGYNFFPYFKLVRDFGN